MTLEVSFGIIVACLPAIRSLFNCGLKSRKASGYVYEADGTRSNTKVNSSNNRRSRITMKLSGIDATPRSETYSMERPSFGRGALGADRDSERGVLSNEAEGPGRASMTQKPSGTHLKAYDEW